MDQLLTNEWVICRICLKNDNTKFYNIFDTITEKELIDLGSTLLDKIELCGAVKLDQENNLPNKICTRCVMLLRAAYKFRHLCQQSQSQLKQITTPMHVKEDSNETIEISYNSDAEEQNIVIKEKVQNVLELEKDYLVEDCVIGNEDISYEPRQISTNRDNGFATDDGIEIIELSNDENSQDAEESYTKIFDYEQNYYEVTSIQGDGDSNDDNIIIEEEIDKEFIETTTNEQQAFVEKKRKRNQVEKVDGIYSCIFCDNAYRDKTKYNNHMKIHFKDKPHECEICKKRFTTTPQLSRHMNSHTGNRPYKCQYCEASFGDPSTKIKHERIHTNERPYKCNLCYKSFAYSNVLKIHMMTHTGEKPHVCELCGKAFSQLHHKNAHEKRHSKLKTVMIKSSPDIELMEEET